MQLEPTPANPYGWLIWLLALTVAFAAGFTYTVLPQQPRHAPESGFRNRPPMMAVPGVPHVINSVEVLQPEPGKVLLAVVGYQPDGCGFEIHTEQSRDGNTVQVLIYRNLPPDALCPQMIVDYAEDILIDGTFTPGSYTFSVNGFTVTAEIE